MKHWKDHGEVLIYDDSNRGAGSIKYPGNDFYTTSLTEAQAKLLESLIDAAHSRGQTTSVSWMKSQLLLNGIKISSRSLKRNLNRLKFGYGRVDEVANLDANFERRRRAKFIARLAVARGLEATGEYIIVFHDECYIHTNHSRNKTWGKKGKRRVRRDRRRGRIIIFHSLTKDGLLVESEFDRNKFVMDDLTQPINSSEYFYVIKPKSKKEQNEKSEEKKVQKDQKKEPTQAEEKSSQSMNVHDAKLHEKEDYHHNIDAALWELYLHNRLIPSFKARYPGKKMILVLDNASYHCRLDPSYHAPSSLNREPLAIKLAEHVSSIVVDRKPQSVTISAADYKKNPRKGGAKVAELRAELAKFYKANPQHRTMVIAKEFDQLGWELLFTPPHTPRFQPIETLWAIVKGKVASRFKNGRSIDETLNQLIEAFYSSKYKKEQLGITVHHCTGIIKYSIKWINEFINSVPDLLFGDLDHLTVVDQSLQPRRNGREMNKIDRGTAEELALAIRAHAAPQMNTAPAAASNFDDAAEAAIIDDARQIGTEIDEEDSSSDSNDSESDIDEQLEEFDYDDDDEHNHKRRKSVSSDSSNKCAS
jgi:transposase